MKVEYINPFIQASQTVFKSLINKDVKMGKVYLRPSPFCVNDRLIMIGVVGKIRGQVCFEIATETCMKIASAMMGGALVTEMDELVKSAIAELGNMIMGNTSTIFSKNNTMIDITPPSMLTGDGIEFSNKTPTIVVPLTIEGIGDIKINITAEEIL